MRKRKSAPTHSKRRRTANPHPLAKRRRVSIKVNGRRRHTRRRNPSSLAGLGLIKDGLYAAIGGLGTTWIRGLVPFSFGGQVGDAAITFGVAIGLGELVGRFFNREAGKMVALGGTTIAATQLLNNYGLTPQRLFAPAPPPAAAPAGMKDIVALPRGSYDQYWGSAPNLSAVPPRRAGMNNIVAVPRSY